MATEVTLHHSHSNAFVIIYLMIESHRLYLCIIQCT